MVANAPLTRNIGIAERTLQALLHQKLNRAALSFAEWTALVYLSTAGHLTEAELAQRLAQGLIVPEDAVGTLVASLVGRGLIRATEGSLELTESGRNLYSDLRTQIDRLTSALFEDLPTADIEATRRTLDTVARRAADLLGA